jgi:hypothetical protein
MSLYCQTFFKIELFSYNIEGNSLLGGMKLDVSQILKLPSNHERI